MPSVVVGGQLGEPDDLGIPQRSMSRIQRAIFCSEEHHNVNRLIAFQAVRTLTGLNISEVVVTTVTFDGRQIDERISILYRDSRFWKATAEYADGSVAEHTLSAAISRINNPVAS